MSHNKKHNKEIREKYRLEQEIKDNPNCCYCYDLVGLYSDIDEDKPIGETEPVDGYPFPASIGFTQKIYICKRCGKEATLPIAFA